MKILDIGCGSGDLLEYLLKKGYTNIEGVDELKHNYDFVMCTAVIEHLCDVEQVIKNLKQYVKVGGYIYIDAPAVECFEKYHSKLTNYFKHELVYLH